MIQSTRKPSTVDPTEVPHSIPSHDAVETVKARGGGIVIDVRTPVEVSSEHIAGALHIPLAELPSRCHELEGIAGPGLLLCQTGKRAEQAREVLVRAGIEDLIVIEGGLEAYTASGGETVMDHKRMSLERQVRVAAGFLVLLGAVPGFLIHPAFHGLSAFVGAGLIFAGITDYCGMGLLIAKMPWNK